MSRILAGLVLLVAATLGAAPLGAAAPVLLKTPVQLKTKVILDDAVVRLGDLFEGAGELGDTVVARAPEPGREVQVDARWLSALAQAYGLAWQPGPRFETTVVTRASQVIDSRRIEREMRDALARRDVEGDISLVLDNPAIRFNLPTNVAPTLAVDGLAYDPDRGRFTAYVVAPATGTPLARATVTGRAIRMAEMPVLARRVEPGEVIGRSLIRWVPMREDRIARGAVTDSDRILGKSPRRPLRAGDPILAADLQEPIMVAKNSLVTITLDTERMALTAQGRALDNGARNDVIRVINTKSNKIINAIVAAANHVRVLPSAVTAFGQEAQR